MEVVTKKDVSYREARSYLSKLVVSSLLASIKNCGKQAGLLRVPRSDVGKDKVRNCRRKKTFHPESEHFIYQKKICFLSFKIANELSKETTDPAVSSLHVSRERVMNW